MKVIAYDRTQGFLSKVWRFGARLFGLIGRADIVIGVSSWRELVEAIEVMPAVQIQRFEWWGHGARGTALCAGHSIDMKELEAFRPAMAPDALWWWRTCSSFCGTRGQLFATQCAETLGCRVAGHTFIIWAWQSGLYVVQPRDLPAWPVGEGWRYKGGVRKNRWSWPWRPNTITALGRGPK